MPVLITASTEEVGMGLVPEDRASARSDEPEARSAARWRGRAAEGARRAGQQQPSAVQQLSPRQLSRPSRAATAAMTSAAAGSAHHQPKAALSVSPTSRAAER